MRRSQIAVTLGLCAIILLSACSPQDQASRGQALFANHCAACHGADARGNGPLAASMGRNAPDLTVLSETNSGVFPIDAVIAQIHGYSGRYLQGRMPEYNRVLESPMVDWTTRDGTVIPTPQSILDITLYVETVQG